MSDADAAAFHRGLELDVLARTIWGEARGEGSAGMRAVANVVMNRVLISQLKGGYWWGGSVIQVCQKPFQFSCWNRDDPNFRRVLGVDKTDAHFNVAMNFAARALDHGLDDITGGATHYHAAGISPNWARNERPCAVIGKHIFYRLVEV